MASRKRSFDSPGQEGAPEQIDLSFVLLSELALILSLDNPADRYYALGDLEDMLYPYWEDDARYKEWRETFLKRSAPERVSRRGCREWLRELRVVMKAHDFDGESKTEL